MARVEISSLLDLIGFLALIEHWNRYFGFSKPVRARPFFAVGWSQACSCVSLILGAVQTQVVLLRPYDLHQYGLHT